MTSPADYLISSNLKADSLQEFFQKNSHSLDEILENQLTNRRVG